MRLPDDNSIELVQDNDHLVVDDTDPPALTEDDVLELMPRFARQGDSLVREATIAGMQAAWNYEWAQSGQLIGAQKSPRNASGDMLDWWGDVRKLNRAADEQDPEYRSRLLLPLRVVTPDAIKGAVDALVSQVSDISAAYFEPATDAAFASPGDGSATWAAFVQPTLKRLWAYYPDSANLTPGAYAVPGDARAQFWVVLPTSGGDDGTEPYANVAFQEGVTSGDPRLAAKFNTVDDCLNPATPYWVDDAINFGPITNAAIARMGITDLATEEAAVSWDPIVSGADLSPVTYLITGGASDDSGTSPLSTSYRVTFSESQEEASAAGGATADGWPTASMPGVRYGHQSVQLRSGGKVLVCGGANASVQLSSCLRYDPLTNTWLSTASMSVARLYHKIIRMQSDIVLAVGGVSTGQTAEKYDPGTDTWSTAGTPIIDKYQETLTLLKSGKVLRAGGRSGANATTACEIYNPATNTWSATGALHVSRCQHYATILPNGKVFVAGGQTGALASGTATAEIFDEQTGTWAQLPSMPGTVNAFGMDGFVRSDGRVCLIGNCGTTMRVFNPDGNYWEPSETMITSQQKLLIMQSRSDVWSVVGGSDSSGAASGLSERYATPLFRWYDYASQNHTFVPGKFSALMERVLSEVETRHGGGVGYLLMIDPLLKGAL